VTLLGEYSFLANGPSDQFKPRDEISGGSVRVHALTLNPAPRLAGDRRISPHVTAGFGRRRRTVELRRPAAQVITVCDPLCGAFYRAALPVTQAPSSYSANKGGWNAGAGFDFSLGEGRAKLFAEVRYHYVSTSPASTQLPPIPFGVRWS
jgi:hypothetical protein